MHSTRSTLPEKVHQIWDCLEHGHGASALVDMERLVSVASAIHKLPKEEFQDEVEKAVADSLVVSETLENKGKEVVVYALPDPKGIEKGEHDWYCFTCHKGGDVLSCEDCPRVFHLDCLPESRKPEKDLFVCPPCHMISSKPSTLKMSLKPKVLNTLLTYICDRLNDWQIQFLMTADPKLWATEAKRSAKEAWRFNMLVYAPIDLNTITEKARTGKYVSLEEFQVDCEALVHAIGSYFGADVLKGNSTGASFIHEALHDIQEIKLCHDCFQRSNEKEHPWWFCLPCTTPHKVVWAKQTGYPFWPAKVMKQEGNKYDVRYFGGNYERAQIDVKNIQPIETSLTTLKVKRNATWNDAYDELQKYMDIEKNPEAANSLPSRGKSSSGKSKAVSKPSKRSATSVGGVAAKKSRGSEQISPKSPKNVQTNQRRSAPAFKTSGASGSSTTPAGTNGVTSQRKKIFSTPKNPNPIRRETGAGSTNRPISTLNPNQNSTMSTLGKQQNIITPRGIPEDIPFDSFFADAAADDLIGDASYSDDEEKKLSEKVPEDTVSSSCNAARTSRNAYVQVSTGIAQTIEAAKKKFEEYHKEVKEHYSHEINANKRKQWCYNCEKEAIYHCCWNTAYCSTECQQQHWTKEHKRLCRRVRRERGGTSGGGHGCDDY